MKKAKLYEQMIARMDHALAEKQFLQAAWYAYAILEDRMTSLLRWSAPNPQAAQIPRMLGPKLQELKSRAQNHRLLAANYVYAELHRWKEDRNDLMHQMADGVLAIEDVDILAEALALEGARLVRTYSAAARRFKAHSS